MNGNGKEIALVPIVIAVSLLVCGGLGTLILWNITQISAKVEAIQVIVYDTKSGLKSAQDRQEENSRAIAEMNGTLSTALGIVKPHR